MICQQYINCRVPISTFDDRSLNNDLSLVLNTIIKMVTASGAGITNFVGAPERLSLIIIGYPNFSLWSCLSFS